MESNCMPTLVKWIDGYRCDYSFDIGGMHCDISKSAFYLLNAYLSYLFDLSGLISCVFYYIVCIDTIIVR